MFDKIMSLINSAILRITNLEDRVSALEGKMLPVEKDTTDVDPSEKNWSNKRVSVNVSNSVRGYISWNESEDKALTIAYKEGKTIKELASIHQRTNGAIVARLSKNGFQLSVEEQMMR